MRYHDLTSAFGGTYPDGSIYTGDFVSGLADGTGKIIYPDGSSYEGGWSAGVIEGEGTAIYANGVTYKGSFQNARNHGFGVMTYSDVTPMKVNGRTEHALARARQPLPMAWSTKVIT